MARKDTTEKFIEKAKNIHGDKYDYSKVNYIHSREDVDIICEIHGIFKQTPSNHLKACGCQKCASLINVYKKEDYIKLADKAILYIVVLEYNNEKFFKIGKTKNTVNQRLATNISVYKHSIIREYKSDSGTIFDLEIMLHNSYTKYKYKPQVIFAGHTECYNLELPTDEIVKSYFN